MQTLRMPAQHRRRIEVGETELGSRQAEQRA